MRGAFGEQMNVRLVKMMGRSRLLGSEGKLVTAGKEGTQWSRDIDWSDSYFRS
jgi:hypothetical protein